MRFILAFILLFSINSFGQYKNYIISPRGDTLNRIDMQGKKQGPWVLHVDEIRGEKGYDEQGYFENDRKEGTWKRFSLDGDLLAVENFRWGNFNGRCLYYTNMGDLVREENWRSVNPDNPYDTVPVMDPKDPTKVVGTTVVKVDGFTMKEGVWKYYDPNSGTVVKTEKYMRDKLVTGADAGNGDDDLRPLDITNNRTDSTGKKAIPKLKEIQDFEKKNSGKKKVKVRDGSTGGY